MEKIKEFMAKHDEAVCIFSKVVIIILSLCLTIDKILEGFTAEQLDENSVFVAFLCFMVFHAFFGIVLDILFILFHKLKSDKE